MSRKVIIILLLLLNILIIRAQNGDSITAPELNHFDLMPVLNLWLNTSNPAGLQMNEGLYPGKIGLKYGSENGDYKRVQQGDKFTSYSFGSQAFKRIKDVNLYGNFSYEKSFEKGLDFSNTNNPFRDTPYGMIDTIGGDNYNNE